MHSKSQKIRKINFFDIFGTRLKFILMFSLAFFIFSGVKIFAEGQNLESEKKSFYINFPDVYGMSFLDSNNKPLSGSQYISEFSKEKGYTFSAKLNRNAFQRYDLDYAKNTEFSLGKNFELKKSYDQKTLIFEISITNYAGDNDSFYTLSLSGKSGNVTEPFVKMTVPSDDYTEEVKFYYLGSSAGLIANNYRITNEILIFPGINFNLYIRIDSKSEYNIDTLSIKLTNGTISGYFLGEGIDFNTEYDYARYNITAPMNDFNVNMILSEKDYKIYLIKTLAGVSQIQYEASYLNGSSFTASTSSLNFVSLKKGEKINFIFKFLSDGYSQLELSEIKLKVYPATLDGLADMSQASLKELNIGKRIETDEKVEIDSTVGISSNELYHSEQYEVAGVPVAFVIEGIKKDVHSLEFITDDEFEKSNYDITQLFDLSSISGSAFPKRIEKLGEDGVATSYYKYVIENVEYGSTFNFSIKFKVFEPGTGYNNSFPIVSATLNNSGESLNVRQEMGGYWTLRVLGDATLKVTNLERNKYKISVPSIKGVAFKSRKVSDNYEGAENLGNYENVPSSNVTSDVRYEDYLSLVAEFDYSAGWNMNEMVLSDSLNGSKVENLPTPEGANYREFLIPRVSREYSLVADVPLRYYSISFNKSEPRETNIYDSSGNILNMRTARDVSISHGSDFEFRVEVDSKYSQSAENMEIIFLAKEDLDKVENNEIEGNVEEIYRELGTTLKPGENGQYKINKIAFSGVIIVQGLEINKYNLTFRNTDSVTFTEFIENEEGIKEEVNIGQAEDFKNASVVKEVTLGDDFEFNYKIAPGFSMIGSQVTLNGEGIRKTNGVYAVSNILENKTIEITDISKVNYRVTFPKNEGLKFTDSSGQEVVSALVKYGSDYSFRTLIDNRYSQSANSILVYQKPGGEEPLSQDSSGAYVVKNLTQPIEIEVKNLKINEYNVSFPVNLEGVVFRIDGIRSDDEDSKKFEDAARVTHGKNFVFSILEKEGYDVSDVQVSVSSTSGKVNAELINSGYIIQNVSGNLEVNVSGIKRKSHTIKLEGDNITFSSGVGSSVEISSGYIDYAVGEFSFTFSPKEGFELVDDYESSWKETFEISPSNFYTSDDVESEDGLSKRVFLKQSEKDPKFYTVSKVTSDITITIKGAVKKKTFKVIFPKVDGVKYLRFDDGNSSDSQSSPNHELPLENTVDYDSTFRFELKAEYGYDISDVQIRYNANKYVSETNGVYFINNIRNDITLELLQINKEDYDLKLKGENITFYDESNENPITNASVQYESGVFKFRLRPNIGYELDLSGDDLSFEIDSQKFNHRNEVYDEESPAIVKGPDDFGVFTVSNVKKSVTISVKGAKKKIYNIHFPINTQGIKLFEYRGSGGPLNEVETAEYLSEFKFDVVPRKGYNVNNLKVTLEPEDNADIKYIDGIYVLSVIRGDVYVNISNVGKNSYKVSFEGDGADFYNSNNVKINNVSLEYGSEYDFKMQSANGYNISNGYEICMYDPLNPDSKVIIDKRGINSTMSASDDLGGFLYDGEDNGGNPIEGTNLYETGRFAYKISNLQGNVVIEINNVAKNRYNIVFPNIYGIEFLTENAQNDVSHGLSFSFKIKELEGYTIKDIKVWANSNLIELVNGSYTIENVTNDIFINVEGVRTTKVDLRFQYTKGVIYKGTDNSSLSILDAIKVDNGSNYSFKVDLSPDYSNSLSKMKIYANREKKKTVDGKEVTEVVKEEIKDVRGVYTLNSITETTNITVENIEINSYKVTLTDSTGIEYLDKYGDKKLSKEEKANYGDSFSFVVNPVKGFVSSNIVVTAKGQNTDKVQLTPVDGVYTIESVKSDYTVVVENVSKSVYKVEIRLLDGVNLLDSGGNKLSTSLTVPHGNDLSFRLSLDEAYSDSAPEVLVKGSNNKVTPTNNIYTIKSVEKDTIVEVSNVVKNTYKINFKETEGVIYKTAKNKVFTGSLEVEYGGSLQFKVDLKDAYDASYPLVLLNGKDAITKSGGTYEIFNVRDDGEIVVENVVKNNESSVIEMVERIDEQIDSANSADLVIEASKKYESLTDDEKDLLTNISKLKNSQERVGTIHHNSNGVIVSGIDWNIKVEAIPMEYDQETVDRLSEKMKRKTVVSLYQIKLVDTLTGEKYDVPYGSEISVSIPAPDLKGYQNEVVVHENSAGSIEYLDVSINDNVASFTTKSFSIFGIAAKEIENLSENPSNVTIAVEKLLDDSNTNLKDLAYNGLESQLGDLTKNSGEISDSFPSGSSSTSSSKSENISDSSGANEQPSFNSKGGGGINTGIEVIDNAYLWAINNEFFVAMLILVIFVVGLLIFLMVTKNKERS